MQKFLYFVVSIAIIASVAGTGYYVFVFNPAQQQALRNPQPSQDQSDTTPKQWTDADVNAMGKDWAAQAKAAATNPGTATTPASAPAVTMPVPSSTSCVSTASSYSTVTTCN